LEKKKTISPHQNKGMEDKDLPGLYRPTTKQPTKTYQTDTSIRVQPPLI
jgi:hypothetical protein